MFRAVSLSIRRHLRSVMIAAGVCAFAISATLASDRGAGAPRSPQATKKPQPKFELRDGDRVVFLGNTLIERAQKYGYWETMLTARYPDRKIIFRNLGWDGDTVWAESRGIFDPPEKGYARMLERVAGIKPTVLFLGYGNNEAYAGKKGLPRFVKQYNKLLDDLTKASAKGVRFVLLSPTLHERPSAAAPPPKEYNESANTYASAIQQIARKHRHIYVDLIQPLNDKIVLFIEGQRRTLDHTYDGLHFDNSGYSLLVIILEQALFGIDKTDQRVTTKTPMGRIIRFSKSDLTITRPEDTKTGIRFRGKRRTVKTSDISDWLGVQGLPRGNYRIQIDGQRVVTGNVFPVADKEWKTGVRFWFYPDLKAGQKLRQAIIAKNRLYFHSWRPQNVTYLFLFRKHEQGQNAKEVKEFLRLVAEKEKEIDRLKKPVTRTYELIRVKPKKN